MKQRHLYAVALIGAAVLLAGCSRQAVVVADPVTGPGPAAAEAEEAPAAASAPAEAEAPASGDTGTDMAAATQVLNASCTACHDLSPIEGSESVYSAAEWRDIIQTMVSYGAAITSAETDLLIDYMVSQGAAPEASEEAAVDTAAATQFINETCAGCHGLDLIEGRESAFSADEWRGIIDRMVSYGASVSSAETDMLVAYMISQGATP